MPIAILQTVNQYEVSYDRNIYYSSGSFTHSGNGKP